MNRRRVLSILLSTIILVLIFTSIPNHEVKAYATVDVFDIVGVYNRGGGTIQVDVQVRFCRYCNPNSAGNPGCVPFTHGYPPPYYPYMHSCGVVDGRYVAILLRDGPAQTGKLIAGPQKIIGTPLNCPLEPAPPTILTFTFTGVPEWQLLTAEADIYCSCCGCGHWYPNPIEKKLPPIEKKLPIIIVPGIMGSKLYKKGTNELVWPNLGKIYDDPYDTHLNALKLKSDGKTPDSDNGGVEVEAKDLVWEVDPSSEITWREAKTVADWLGIKFGVGKTNVYKGLKENLANQGYDVYSYPYDWRLDIAISAQGLAKRIDEVLEDQKKKYGEESAPKKVVLIGHSMGGLVSRYAIKKGLNNAHLKVKKLITIGTPHLGSVDAYISIWWGAKITFLNDLKAKELTPNFLGLYQMLPNQEFFNETHDYLFYDGWIGKDGKTIPDNGLTDPIKTYKTDQESKLPNPGLVDAAKKFWEKLDAWNKLGTLPDDVEVYLIAGSNLWTENTIYLNSAAYFIPPKLVKLTDWFKSPQLIWTNGDKTVSLFSALGLTGNNVKKYCVRGIKDHTHLPSEEITLKVIEAILKNEEPSDVNVHKHDGPHVDDWLPGKKTLITGWSPESMDLHVFDSTGHHLGRNETQTTVFDDNIFDNDYWLFSDTENALLLDNDTYKVVINSTGQESLLLLKFIQISENGTLTRSFSYNAPIGPYTTGWMNYDPFSPSPPDLLMDYDGDNIYETIVKPSSIVYVESLVNTAAVNDTFTVNITASNVNNLWSWQTGFQWDPSILELINFAWGDFQKYALTTTRTDGTIDNTAGSIDPPFKETSTTNPVTRSDLSLLSLTFKIKRIGISKLNITDSTLVNSNLMEIPFFTINGTVQGGTRNVAIISLSPSENTAEKGHPISIDVTITNKGDLSETFNTTVYADQIALGMQTVTLSSGSSATVTFIWDTSGFAQGNYTVSAYATPVPYEIDTADNTLVNDSVSVTLPEGEHNIAVTNVVPSKTVVRQGNSVNIDVTVENQGDYPETFNVTAYANTTEIETKEITLTSGSSETFTFTWDTTGFAKRNYTISAYAWPVSGETDTADNTLVNGQVSVTDCFIATAAYGTPMAEEIEVLRDFRDEYLLTNPVGKALVEFYYKVSPPMAEFITEHPALKQVVRAGLVPAIAMSTVAVNTTLAENTMIVGLLVLVSVAVCVTRRQRRGPEYT